MSVEYITKDKECYEFSPDIIEMESKLTEALGTRVQIEALNAGGKIHIDYFSETDLRNILDFIKKSFDKDSARLETNTESMQKIADATPLIGASAPVLNTPTPSEVVESPVANLMDANVSTEEQKILQEDMPKEDKKEDEEFFDLNNFTV